MTDIDLQWFASAEDEGRTEKPSEFKIKKAREEGRVAKSQEVTGALVMLLPILVILALAPWFYKNCVQILRFYLDRCTELELNDPTIYAVFGICLFKMVLPVAAAAIAAGFVGNIIQTRGFVISTKPIQPKFSKIVPNFANYFKKTLFSSEGVFNVVKSIFKVAVVFIVSYVSIKKELPNLLSLMNVSLWNGVVYIAKMTAKLLIIAAGIFLIISVPDYLVQRHQFMESLKMTKQEVKEEFKELEGDPFIKSRLRRYMHQLMTQQVRQNVAEADVVITNPTHYAVALKYERETMRAPMVTAKGVDELALRIKQIARENDVEIVENRPLARALYAEVEIGDIIPEAYYSALSIILQRVYSLKAKKKAVN